MVSQIRISAVFVAIASATVLSVGLGLSNARSAGAQVPTVSVTLVHDGVETRVDSSATDVAGFLIEQHLTVEPDDYLSMLPQAPIENGSRIEIGTAKDVLLHVNGNYVALHTGAPTVAAALLAAGVRLNPHDEVMPALDAPVGSQISVVHVRTWTKTERVAVPGGVRAYTYRYVQRDRNTPARTLAWSKVLHLQSPDNLTRSALRMIATAYVPWCPGCSGITKTGLRAGRGIVAVDPNVIPLGSKLFIPGYGHAIAGDTGGAIVGSRIDLGFDDYGTAMQFGRREITVYVLR